MIFLAGTSACRYRQGCLEIEDLHNRAGGDEREVRVRFGVVFSVVCLEVCKRSL